MELNKKLLGNKKPQKIVIDAREDTFDFTLYKTHVVIIIDEIEKYNLYAEILITSKNQKNRAVVEFPISGNNVLVKIETNYKKFLTVRIEVIEQLY